MLVKEENKTKWGDKVRIIGYSIDQTKEAVKKHVDAKGWGAVEHYHKGKSNGDSIYEVQGVPHVMLIDKEGVIAFKGHPANRSDLEEDFGKLLNGEKLTGEGCASAESGDGGDAGPKEGFADFNPDILAEDIKK
jgi:hypothetical protein